YVYPAWSADSKQIAYSSVVDADLEIFVYDLKTRETRQLTHLGGSNGLAAWSRDGSRIAFQHTSSGELTGSLYLMDSSGNDIRVILKAAGPIEGGRPAWRAR